jgi:transcriptional regulator with XRE-family HTH domain
MNEILQYVNMCADLVDLMLTRHLSAPSVTSMDTHSLVAPDVLARRIRMLMGDQKLSRKRLAEATGISRPSLANKLDGKVSFTYDELLRIVTVLDVAWDELLAGHDDTSRLADASRTYEPVRLRDFQARPDRRL